MSGKAIRETLGFLGVIASMVFVGMEIRGNTVAARSAAYQVMGVELANLYHDWSMDPEVADLLSRGLAGRNLTEAETVQFTYLYVSALRLYETTWRQVELGLLDAEHLQWFGWSQYINPDNLPLRPTRQFLVWEEAVGYRTCGHVSSILSSRSFVWNRPAGLVSCFWLSFYLPAGVSIRST